MLVLVLARKVDMYCEMLNEQISAERYRTAGAGCGRGDNTPFIRDTALLSFRHSFALNVQVRDGGANVGAYMQVWRCFRPMVLSLKAWQIVMDQAFKG